jgi:hypothetical protein
MPSSSSRFPHLYNFLPHPSSFTFLLHYNYPQQDPPVSDIYHLPRSIRPPPILCSPAARTATSPHPRAMGLTQRPRGRRRGRCAGRPSTPPLPLHILGDSGASSPWSAVLELRPRRRPTCSLGRRAPLPAPPQGRTASTPSSSARRRKRRRFGGELRPLLL